MLVREGKAKVDIKVMCHPLFPPACSWSHTAAVAELGNIFAAVAPVGSDPVEAAMAVP